MDRPDTLALRRSLLAAQPIALAARPPSSDWLDDLKLFAAACLGGLVFFGTFIA